MKNIMLLEGFEFFFYVWFLPAAIIYFIYGIIMFCLYREFDSDYVGGSFIASVCLGPIGLFFFGIFILCETKEVIQEKIKRRKL